MLAVSSFQTDKSEKTGIYLNQEVACFLPSPSCPALDTLLLQ